MVERNIQKNHSIAKQFWENAQDVCPVAFWAQAVLIPEVDQASISIYCDYSAGFNNAGTGKGGSSLVHRGLLKCFYVFKTAISMRKTYENTSLGDYVVQIYTNKNGNVFGPFYSKITGFNECGFHVVESILSA